MELLPFTHFHYYETVGDMFESNPVDVILSMETSAMYWSYYNKKQEWISLQIIFGVNHGRRLEQRVYEEIKLLYQSFANTNRRLRTFNANINKRFNDLIKWTEREITNESKELLRQHHDRNSIKSKYGTYGQSDEFNDILVNELILIDIFPYSTYFELIRDNISNDRIKYYPWHDYKNEIEHPKHGLMYVDNVFLIAKPGGWFVYDDEMELLFDHETPGLSGFQEVVQIIDNYARIDDVIEEVYE